LILGRKRRGELPSEPDARNTQARVRYRRGSTILLLAAAFVIASAVSALGIGAANDPTATSQDNGKRIYRKYCGQCHALRAARAVGFGSNGGLGKDGGPSFNLLRVPYSLSMSLLTQASNGHEQVTHKLRWVEIRDVARFTDAATKHNPVLALPTDG
jgi:mono/diheme cytochrome c family protein